MVEREREGERERERDRERGTTHFTRRIHRIVHYLEPALESGNLEEGQVGEAHVVKGNLGVDPLGVVLGEAGRHVRRNLVADADQGVDVAALQIQGHQGLAKELCS